MKPVKKSAKRVSRPAKKPLTVTSELLSRINETTKRIQAEQPHGQIT